MVAALHCYQHLPSWEEVAAKQATRLVPPLDQMEVQRTLKTFYVPRVHLRLDPHKLPRTPKKHVM